MSVTVLEAELLAHLDVQLASAQRLLGLVLAQGAAIRERDVDSVLARLADIQTEMARRGRLDQDRAHLLTAAGTALGVAPASVTLDGLCHLVSPGAADAARERSVELRGLLAEIACEHGINRALMRQELSFLSHLVRLVGAEHEGAYTPAGRESTPQPARPASPAAHRVLDLQA